LVKQELIAKIRKDLSPLKNRKEILAILLYGSQLHENLVTSRSDIDICVVAPDIKNHMDLQLELYHIVRNEKYDVKVFELLPLYLKMEIIKEHEIIFTRNRLDLYEYFYFYRKIWKDQEYRNTLTEEEYRELLIKKEEKIKQLKASRATRSARKRAKNCKEVTK